VPSSAGSARARALKGSSSPSGRAKWPSRPFRARLLDGLVRYRFGENAELMGAWASARNVLRSCRSKAEPEPSDGECRRVEGPVA